MLFLQYYFLISIVYFDRTIHTSEEFEPFRQKLMGHNLTAPEGFILGVGAKMFTIAGPVIVYGLAASVVYGFIYWIMQML